MISVVNGANREQEHVVLRAMFEARKSVFIDLLKWDIPALAGRYEIDHFDNPHASYLILADPDGRHRASARLLPTIRPGILDTLFPELCEGELPSGPSVFEITRFCLSRDMRAPERRLYRNRLVTALAQYARDNEIVTYTGVADMAWTSQILGFGWDCAPLGLPLRYKCGQLCAIRIDIAADTIGRLKQTGVYEECTAFMQLAD
ncbi:acyl-homoserine-lactone synthase [Sphingomonas sp.]|uniref:acyl-homoserine-lactone synthase n=1 Tax=Sphingomonas sp. TaxID=28214 RepID=UPI0025E15E81|nr:acyl-homoserine-lactone synthase [Sphingomonas sp.]